VKPDMLKVCEPVSKKAELEVIATADDQTSSSNLECDLWVKCDKCILKKEENEIIGAGSELNRQTNTIFTGLLPIFPHIKKLTVNQDVHYVFLFCNAYLKPISNGAWHCNEPVINFLVVCPSGNFVAKLYVDHQILKITF